MAGRNEWRVSSVTGSELEEKLNRLDSEGWDISHIFQPEDSSAQFFTVVSRRDRGASAQAGGRSMGFAESPKG